MSLHRVRLAPSGPPIEGWMIGTGDGVAFARAFRAAQNDVSYQPPIDVAGGVTADAAVITAGGIPAETQLTIPDLPYVENQRFRMYAHFAMGYLTIAGNGAPPQALRVDLQLQWRLNNAGAWATLKPFATTQVNGATSLEFFRDAGAPLSQELQSGIAVHGDHLFSAVGGDVVNLRVAWNNRPINQNDYLTVLSITQSEGETGGWHLEQFLALGDVAP